MKTVCNVVVYVILALVVVFAAMLLLPQVFGLKVYGVLSGSMEPMIKKGSIIYVQPADVSEITVDQNQETDDNGTITKNDSDVITFKLGSSETICTHRVVEMRDDEQVFITKGDASDNLDLDPVPYTNLIGVYKFTIPFVGFIAQFMQSLPGYITAAALLALMIVCSIIADAGKKKERAFATATATDNSVSEPEAVIENMATSTDSTVGVNQDDNGEVSKEQQ